MVQELNSKWWWVGGHVEEGETDQQACLRECKEESGLDIEIKGILSVKTTNNVCEFKYYIIYYAEPVDEHQTPKTEPDTETLQARWVSIDEFNTEYVDKLRDQQPKRWFNYIAQGGAYADLYD